LGASEGCAEETGKTVEEESNTRGSARFVLYRAVPLIAVLVVVAACTAQPVTTHAPGLALEGLLLLLMAGGIFVAGFMGHNLACPPVC
jgi:hypothetical protein